MHKQSPPATVNELIDRYLAWAVDYYRDPDLFGDRVPTGEANNLTASLSHFRHVAGFKHPSEASADDLCAMQQHMQRNRKSNGKPYTRAYINKCCNVVRRCFRWAAKPPQRWVSTTVIEDMRLADGLKAGRCDAVDPPSVSPVSEEHFRMTQSRIATFSESRPLWAMRMSTILDILWHSGMRPIELLRMRNDDSEFVVERPQLSLHHEPIEILVYKPRRHKTRHHGIDRNIFLSPTCRTQVEQWRARTEQGERLFPYTTGSLREAVLRLNARSSNGLGEPERPIPRWTPYQIRHAFATRLRAEAGIDVLQVLLGHRNRSTTEIYARPDATAAIDAIYRFG